MASSSSNKKKAEQLGMSYGKAAHRLRKMLMFDLLTETGRNVCFRCEKPILQIDTLSVEHKEPWLDSDDPLALFFSPDNIAFSHLKCNVGASRRPARQVGSSGFRGVAYKPNSVNARKVWMARVYHAGDHQYAGRYCSALAAAKAHDQLALELLGPDAVTNASLGLLTTDAP